MALPFFRTMSSSRRIRHQASRKQLVRKVFYFYILTFVYFFPDLHFVGIKHSYPSFHREYLPVNTAAIQALSWAVIGPVLWVLHEYVLRSTELWRSFSDLDGQMQQLVLGGAGVAMVMTVLAGRRDVAILAVSGCCCSLSALLRPKGSL